MFNATIVSNSLAIPSMMLTSLIKNTVSTDNKNYIWSGLSDNVFGLTEFRSRTPQFDTPWHPKSIFSIPDLEQPFDKKIADVFDQRAVDIYNRSKILNKRIVIMWSGGIDSTSMLSAFIKNLSNTDLDNITVCASTQSIAENPYFYETQIRGRLRMMHLTDLNFCNEFLAHNILLHGDPGDCIFGPSVGKYKLLWPSDLHLKSWKDSQSVLYQLYHDPANLEFSGWYVDMISQNLLNLQHQGFYNNIKTISDWHWWQYFNFKWQGSLCRALINHKKNPKEKIEPILLDEFFDLGFFSAADFQIWSYQNLSTLCQNPLQDHKLQAKKYIFELDKNDQYLVGKKKEHSLIPNYTVPLVIDQHGVHYHFRDPGVVETFQQLLVN
jgi:hypothetical protein